jgi:hypothetical protein
MVALALGVLIGAGIVLGLAVDWIKHPDLIPVAISQRERETYARRHASNNRSRQK